MRIRFVAVAAYRPRYCAIGSALSAALNYDWVLENSSVIETSTKRSPPFLSTRANKGKNKSFEEVLKISEIQRLA